MKAALPHSCPIKDQEAVERIIGGTLKITGNDRLHALWLLSYAAGIMVWETGTENGPKGHVTLDDAMKEAAGAVPATVQASLDKMLAEHVSTRDTATVEQACRQPNKAGR